MRGPSYLNLLNYPTILLRANFLGGECQVTDPWLCQSVCRVVSCTRTPSRHCGHEGLRFFYIVMGGFMFGLGHPNIAYLKIQLLASRESIYWLLGHLELFSLKRLLYVVCNFSLDKNSAMSIIHLHHGFELLKIRTFKRALMLSTIIKYINLPCNTYSTGIVEPWSGLP